METLRKGMTSNKVKELQQMLRDAGFFTHPTNTGYFGDITETALKKYQQSKGMEANGIYSPTTNPNLARESEAKQFLTAIKGTPDYDLIKSAYDSGDLGFLTGLDAVSNPVNKGMFIGNQTVVTPEQMSQARGYAEKDLNPYFDNRASYEGALYSNDLQGIQNTYDTNQQDLQQQAEADRVALNEQEGSRGTWSSNARDQRMNSLQNKYNNKSRGLYNNAYNDMSKLNIGREYNYGTGSVNMSPITQYTSQLSQTAPATFNQTQQTYNPFNPTAGYQNLQRGASIKSRTFDLLNKNNPNLAKYL